MELLQKKIRPLYFKYLSAAFGSALISSIYSIVDMVVVGQYEGPNGTAALAIVAPVWNIIYSLGLLTGIGGSVLYSSVKGNASKNDGTANSLFTTALIGTSILAMISWLLVMFFDKELLMLFGAEETLLPLALDYLKPLKYVVPVFIFNQMLAAFLRNDNNPGLATAAVLTTGILNAIGDVFFTFTLDMGIFGAGLATAIGGTVSLLIMLTHFKSKKNTLKLVKPNSLIRKSRLIAVTGFSTFFVDIAMGILTMLFNRQILRYAGTDALSVYGIIVNISTIVQCCAYSVGQAAQPILSINYGAKQWERIRETLKYALRTVAFFSIAWTAVTLAFPNGFIRLFMTPTESVLAIAPVIIRRYCLSFILMPLNVFSAYYFQSLLKPGASFAVSISRGFIVSGVLIFVLPMVFGGDAMWFAMPLTELLVAIGVVTLMAYYTKNLNKEKAVSAKMVWQV
ncbi:MATE family efflux transporter [Brucepastera parasyntrophica]|uniref:MATE family efflux transporter n=1 Tax=Brucepastera parasyntrophica TaxID=2880008 RepID=UPI00210F1A12|nr:MATE family efflux transporter [Brucepastera parasyntrophica]ULQ59149.1 MATE family efflux transporter [Brucepastera parasyntrophica]